VIQRHQIQTPQSCPEYCGDSKSKFPLNKREMCESRGQRSRQRAATMPRLLASQSLGCGEW